jgi:hypothetical protein
MKGVDKIANSFKLPNRQNFEVLHQSAFEHMLEMKKSLCKYDK